MEMKPKYVRLDPNDSGEGLCKIFFTHPDQFVPKKLKEDDICFWGFPEEEGKDEEGIPGHMIRMISMQRVYGFLNKLEKPEVQFIEKLIERKVKKISASAEKSKELSKSDFIFTISLPKIKLGIYRKVKVSSNISLFAFW